MTAFDDTVLAAIVPLREAGFGLHWLHARDKAPVGDDWSTKPVATLEALRRRHVSGYNLGVRLGEQSRLVDGRYLHVIDLDIRDEALASVAMAALLKLFPDAEAWPCVKSGSGGSSRHFYFLCDTPFRSKKLAQSAGFQLVFDAKKKRDVKRRDWEVELFGSGKQVAMPPSIHPVTGQSYEWLREFDLDALTYGVGPYVAAKVLEKLGAIDREEFATEELKPRLGMTLDEAEAILDELPVDAYCEDRDGWLQVGMALHHEFGGEGWELWCNYSKQSAKFDEREQRIVWKSFRDKPNSFRMASLKAAVNTARLMAMFEDEDDDGFDEPAATAAPAAQAPAADDFGDIIGSATAAPAEDEDDEDDDDGEDDVAEEDEFEALLNAASKPGKLEWMSLLQTTKEGDGWAANLHNLELIVTNDPRLKGLAQLNEFTQETMQRTVPGTKAPRRKNQAKPVRQLEGRIWNIRDTMNGELWSDDRDFAIRSILEAPQTQGGYGIKVSDRDLKAAIVLAANTNPYHPVREYLEGIAWDGVKRIETLFIDYMGAEDNCYTRDVGRLMLTAAVTRIFEPGHKFDFATILEGLQGKRKSTFIGVLGRNWFAELDGDFHDPKQMIELMQGAWILELPELTGFQKSDVRAIKAFISRQKDRARLAYARRAGEFPRQCIFIGSTNDREYLKDDTGGRRFWPITCRVAEIDTESLQKNVDQIWAEAVASYRSMRAEKPVGTLPLYLVNEESRLIAAGLQESRRVESAEDGVAGMISAWLDRPIDNGGFDAPGGHRLTVCLPELWVECMRGDIKAYKGPESQMLGRAMKKVPGWESEGQKRHPIYGSQRTYRRIFDEQPAPQPPAGREAAGATDTGFDDFDIG